jgi:hypothetical protein
MIIVIMTSFRNKRTTNEMAISKPGEPAASRHRSSMGSDFHLAVATGMREMVWGQVVGVLARQSWE